MAQVFGSKTQFRLIQKLGQVRTNQSYTQKKVYTRFTYAIEIKLVSIHLFVSLYPTDEVQGANMLLFASSLRKPCFREKN